MRLVRSVSFLGGFVLANLIGASAFAAERQVYMNEAGWEVYLDRSASDPNEHVCKMITTDVFKKVGLFYNVGMRIDNGRISQYSTLALHFNRVDGRIGQELSEPSQSLNFSFRMGNGDYTTTSAVAKTVNSETDPVAAVIYSVDERFNGDTAVNLRFAGRGTAEAEILEMDNGTRLTASFDTKDSIYPANAMNKCVNELRQSVTERSGLARRKRTIWTRARRSLVSVPVQVAGS